MLNFLTADFSESFAKFFSSMGIASMPWGNVVMILVSFLLMYLAIKKKYEPLLLLTIAFGMLCTNLPGANMFNSEIFAGGHIDWQRLANSGGLFRCEKFLTEHTLQFCANTFRRLAGGIVGKL